MATGNASTKSCKEQDRDLDCSVMVPRQKIYNLLSQPICEEPWVDRKEDPDRNSQYNLLGQRIVSFPEDAEMRALGGDCQMNGNYSILGQRLQKEAWQPREDGCEKRNYNLLGQAIKKPG